MEGNTLIFNGDAELSCQDEESRMKLTESGS